MANSPAAPSVKEIAMKSTHILFAGLVAVAALVLPAGRAAAEDYAVQVEMYGVIALTPIDADSPGDFLSEISIGGVAFRSDPILDRDRVAPGWSHYAVFSREDLLGGGPVGIDIGLRDTDDRLGVSSKPIDIAGRGNQLDLHYALRFDPRGGAVRLFDSVTGRPVRQLQPLPGGNRWTTGRMTTGGAGPGPSARVGIQIDVVRLPRYRW
jgi:hypothetical protein